MKEKDRQRIIKETEESLCERQSLSWGLLQGHEDVPQCFVWTFWGSQRGRSVVVNLLTFFV